MNTLEFYTLLKDNDGKSLEFLLPDGEKLTGDLHITEVMNSHIKSVDCGGRASEFNETVVQLWINESSIINAKWSTDKAFSILKKVESVQSFSDEAELFIEFGDSVHPTIRYTVNEVNDSDDDLIIKLEPKATACKPRLELDSVGSCC